MKFELETYGTLNIEKMFCEQTLKAEEKLLLIYLHHKNHYAKINTIDLEEIQNNCNDSITEMLFRLQLKGFVKVETGKVVILFQEEGNKLCSKCKAEKPIDDFYNNQRATDGRDMYCKDCRLDWNKERDANQDPEERREYEREYKAKKKLEKRMQIIGKELSEMIENDVKIRTSLIATATGIQRETIEKYDALKEMINDAKMEQEKKRQEKIKEESKKDRTGIQYKIDRSGQIIVSESDKDFLFEAFGVKVKESELKEIPKKEKQKNIIALLLQGKMKQKAIAEYLEVSPSDISVVKHKFLKTV